MLVTLFGIVMLVSPESWKAKEPMLVTLFGIVMLVSPVQPSKASEPMLVTLFGILTLVKLLHLLNALEGIAVTPSGIVMDVTSSLFIYNFLLFVPYLIKSSNPEILNHAAISVIYMS